MPPGRKGKVKQSEGLDANEARLALQQLDRNEQLPHDTLLKVFKLGQTPCPPACGTKGSKGSKDNPECFHGLMPAEGSFRKKGLWQKEPVLGQLGHDPADDKRQVSSTQHCSSTTAVHSMLQKSHLVPSCNSHSSLAMHIRID
jgi:ubiquitin carboxyl-terminal hydrolase 48